MRKARINPMPQTEFRQRLCSVRSASAVLTYVLVLVLLAAGYVHSTGPNGASIFSAGSSRDLFYFLSGVQMALIGLAAPGLAAGRSGGGRKKQPLNIESTAVQSSFAVIMYKLLSSIGFMMLLVIATFPVYSLVLLSGGIAPSLLLALFLLYLFVVLVLGAAGVFFSTLFRKTMIAVIATYGAALLIFAGTGLAAIFLSAVSAGNSGDSWGPGLALGLNPMAALLGILNPEFSQEVFGPGSPVQLWHIFFPAYGLAITALLWFSRRCLRTVYMKPLD
ncbi:MAG: hypothetical protein K0R57_6474 [Paenibacillaceae bacterium]|jgi:hypothetical protein|nr:hypothetical protein [Paenibacillaceae bacterium]